MRYSQLRKQRKPVSNKPASSEQFKKSAGKRRHVTQRKLG